MSFARNTLPPQDAATLMRYDANKRSALLAYALWFFLGYFGLHRLYLGRVTSGLVMLGLTVVSGALTAVFIGFVGLGLVALWWLIDALLIPGMTTRYNEKLIARLR